jgi:SPX domain protein involved in polyphosphate accumulation
MSLAVRDNSGTTAREDTALLPKQKDKDKDSTVSAQSLEEGGGEEFFPLLESELKKINNFYVGKASEIKLSLDLIQVKRQNWLQSHHTGNKPTDLMQIRDLYIDCRALVSYQKLNKTGILTCPSILSG